MNILVSDVPTSGSYYLGDEDKTNWPRPEGRCQKQKEGFVFKASTCSQDHWFRGLHLRWLKNCVRLQSHCKLELVGPKKIGRSSAYQLSEASSSG
jgi:hypothetical protein